MCAACSRPPRVRTPDKHLQSSSVTAVALTTLGKYEIHGTLGKGAMGIVYDGFDPVIERRVAIKTIAKQSIDAAETAELLGRFKREAQAAGRLNHPGIVSIHDYGEADGLAYIAMEFIQGSELKRYFESKQRFELTHIVRIMCDILDALDHAHRNGVVHRDIKPANIMITDEGRVKIADFGVAWIESSTMTQVGTRIGTPAYMSPEQHQGMPVTGRSDLFSAGVILYQFLTGERPFAGSGYPLIQKILLQEPVPPSEIDASLPRGLDAVTLKALAKRPEGRFASACEFAEAFRRAATGASAAPAGSLVLNDEALRNRWRAVPRPGSEQAAMAAGSTAVLDSASNLANVSLEAELEYWREIKDSTEATDFETFLLAFPGSRFAPLARRRMKRLETDASARAETDEPAQQNAPEHACIAAAEQAHECAVEEAAGDAVAEGERLEAGVPARHQTELQHQRDDETPRLTEAGTWSATTEHPCNDAVQVQEVIEPVIPKTERRKREKIRTRRQRKVDERSWRIDAVEPKLVFPLQGETNDMTPAVDPSASMMADAPLATAGALHFNTEDGPVHARHRAAKPSPLDVASAPRYPGASSVSRKPARLPVVAVLAAVLATSGWYATRSDSGPIITGLRMQAQTIWALLEQLTSGAEETQSSGESARLTEEQRTNEHAPQAERDRQLALAREKEESAKAVATRNYERALALLNQGRSSEAVRLLRQLANRGHGPAAKTLGDLYSRGEDVLLDMQEASLFYTIAERNGIKVER
jgi:tRNA A-37 threonylcarbamoyl transferase component Bud32